MKNIFVSLLIVFTLILLPGCETFNPKTVQTVELAAKIATSEVAAKLKPNERQQLKSVLTRVATNLRGIAASDFITLSAIVDAVASSGVANDNSDILRWAKELSWIVETQWQGIAIKPARVNGLAKELEALASGL